MTDTGHHHHDHGAPDSGARVNDPVCGMSVDPQKTQHRTRLDDRDYFFCNPRCREKFIADPAKYLAPKPANSPPAPVPLGAIWTCPMHPEIRRDKPGACPLCGMALEPAGVAPDASPNLELVDMTRRFWIGVALALPVVLLDMGGHWLHLEGELSVWLQFAFASPVVLWAGAPFFARGWASLRNRSLNMFSLIALGTGAAYLYSLAATFAPSFFPASLRQDAAWSRSITKRPPSSPFSSCSARCWSCARASAPAARSVPCSTSRRRSRAASAPTAAMKRFRSIACSMAIACACGPAMRCRSTAA